LSRDRENRRRGLGLQRLAIVLWVASCGAQRQEPADSIPDGAGDVLSGDAGEAAIHDARAADVAIAAEATVMGDATKGTVNVVNLQSGLSGTCLPEPLAASTDGEAECEMFYVLAAGDSCAAHSGLSTTAADVTASLQSGVNGLGASQPICVITQLPEAAWVSGSCSTSSSAGWCYLTGSAAGNCAQTLVPCGPMPPGAIAILGCEGIFNRQ
jgi:hypothetical protein